MRAKYVLPAPALFLMPSGTPATARDEIIDSFQLFWSDYDACANKLRSALEALMDHFKVKGTTVTKQKQRIRLDLHRRIELFRPRAPELADHLLAAKWIGNTGVHSGALAAWDIYDGMDLIEHSLQGLIGKRSSSLRRMAKTITKRKAPRSK